MNRGYRAFREMKAEKLCSLPSPFSIDLLRAISEKLQANNLHPIKKTSRKIGNKKNEKLSSSWTMFYYEGHTVPMAGHFSCLIWRLNAGREDEEPSSSLLLAVSPCNLAGRPLVQLSQSAGSAVRAVLDSRETRRLWRNGQSLPTPPFTLTFRLIWTWRETLLRLQWATPDSYEGGLADKKVLLSSAQFPGCSVIPEWLTGDL